ncbi:MULTISPECIES: ankyrin repeat domain-containing protein [unclassified Campylobacter]|uniref:ankyrin repeat domain-containing protein n=1 Tax=unclassified Campylobacter TaxID=2593542 RepID=UPI0022E9A1A8|nr:MULTISPECIES: ankyrin repeat domain-containing protein [unclassified Campylobacter]MDA3079011.1 ankyrin repeat domain-containing protein [Campylobacter sp. CS_NA2]MDA3080698.1 ankyrin repeat domain-containing protein [Campylobacter sp. CS_NA1]MDA3085097.1 ankyrin repeat domain-containing protein [Campylobacter sp. CS_ED1]MDA3089874.1 ankyrin repeat domain-containing protein [Campylobacter sp. CS_ED2]WBR51569.1 ankyrin repeat domain-containing protein [Campylobacter sp. CS_NA3]
MKNFIIGFIVVIIAVLALNSDFMGGRKIKTFSVTADTNVSQVKGLSKYVTQEEVDGFAFRYWDIDADKVMNNEKMEALRLLLKSKNTQEILAYMKDNNIRVDEPLHYGVTPLMYSAFYDDIDTAKELLNLGANPHLYDKYNLCALSYAIQNEKVEMVKFLLENGVKFEEAKVVQGYLVRDWEYIYNLDNNVIERIYSEPYVFKHGFTAYYPFFRSNVEIKKIALESGFRPYAYATFNVDYPKIKAGNSLEEILTKSELDLSIDNKKKSGNGIGEFNLELALDEMKYQYSAYRSSMMDKQELELLLDFNISGQPSQKVMRYFYKGCYHKYKSYVANKANYIIDMKTGTDLKKEQEIFDKYKDEYAKKIRKTESVSPYSEVPIWMIMNALEKDGLIVRTPMEIKPELVNFFDKSIELYSKYCGDKDLDFDKLIYLDEKIIKDKTQYHAAFNYSKKQLDENANFKDVKSFLMYVLDNKNREYIDTAIVKNINITHKDYVNELVQKYTTTESEKNIFYRYYREFI